MVQHDAGSDSLSFQVGERQVEAIPKQQEVGNHGQNRSLGKKAQRSVECEMAQEQEHEGWNRSAEVRSSGE